MADPQKSAQQELITKFSLSPSGYTGSQGTAGYVGSSGTNGTNGYTGSAGPAGIGTAGPKITAIAYSGDDTATNTAGGETITLTGSGFVTGATVIVNDKTAGVVSVVDATTITFTAPANSAGSYIVYVINTDGGTAISIPGLQYSGTPVWTTAAGSLGSPGHQSSFTANVVATGDAPITYSLLSGTLPSGVTVNGNTGVISGNIGTVSGDTSYNFTIRATDLQQQDTDRAFSITVIKGVTVEYLVVAGGGGNTNGAGAGAGGYLAGNILLSSGTAHTVTVGAGGADTARGGNSSLSTTILAYGGGSTGYGGGANVDGGSGSGGNFAASSGNPYRAGFGVYPGSPYIDAPRQGYDGGGGGGGAGGPPSGSNGGPGITNSITGSAYTYSIGGDQYTGSFSTPVGGPGSGTIGHGGGGRGGWNGSGNGIVVIRYADTIPAAASTTGSPTITVANGYRVYIWNSSGSITF